MLRSIGKQSGESAESVLKKKREATAVKQSVSNVVALRGGGAMLQRVIAAASAAAILPQLRSEG